MIKAICKWFRDVFGPLTESEQVAMARDACPAYRVDLDTGLSYPVESATSRVRRLRDEAAELQMDIATAEARHQRVSHLRKALSRTMGELLVAVS